MRLQTFDFDVQYRKGQCIIVPDTLSCRGDEDNSPAILSFIADPSWSIPVDWDTLKTHQQFDMSLVSM